jgi:hypothetical protein
MRARAGSEGALERVLRALVERSRAASGKDAPGYVLARCSEDPAVLELRECYPAGVIPDIAGDGAQTGSIAELDGLIEGRPLIETLIETDD